MICGKGRPDLIKPPTIPQFGEEFQVIAGFDADGHPKGHLVSTGLRPKFLTKLAQSGVTVDTSVFAFDRR